MALAEIVPVELLLIFTENSFLIIILELLNSTEETLGLGNALNKELLSAGFPVYSVLESFDSKILKSLTTN